MSFLIKKNKLIHKDTKSIINSNFSFLTGIDILTSNASVIIKFKNPCGDLIECTMSISDFENPKILMKTLKNKGFTFTKDSFRADRPFFTNNYKPSFLKHCIVWLLQLSGYGY